jgi:uncharacterized cupredoxin-like copper-binding protein
VRGQAGPRRPGTRKAALAFALFGLIAAGCAGGPSDAGGTPERRTIEATLNDDMRIELSGTEFSVGETVVFEVTNAGTMPHELYLGDEAAQEAHAEEMAEMDGTGHDEPGGVSVAPGTTEELEYTFARAGETLAGCHEPGHYEAGMVTSLSVAE